MRCHPPSVSVIGSMVAEYMSFANSSDRDMASTMVLRGFRRADRNRPTLPAPIYEAGCSFGASKLTTNRSEPLPTDRSRSMPPCRLRGSFDHSVITACLPHLDGSTTDVDQHDVACRGVLPCCMRFALDKQIRVGVDACLGHLTPAQKVNGRGCIGNPTAPFTNRHRDGASNLTKRKMREGHTMDRYARFQR